VVENRFVVTGHFLCRKGVLRQKINTKKLLTFYITAIPGRVRRDGGSISGIGRGSEWNTVAPGACFVAAVGRSSQRRREEPDEAALGLTCSSRREAMNRAWKSSPDIHYYTAGVKTAPGKQRRMDRVVFARSRSGGAARATKRSSGG